MLDWMLYTRQLGLDSPDNYLAAVKRVTSTDVDRVARTYFAAGKIAVATVVPTANALGPSTLPPPQASTTGGDAKLPQWASDLTDVARLAIAGASQPVEATLPNGLRIITFSRPHAGLVQVFGRVKVSPPMASPAGEYGVDVVLNHLFANGPSDMSRQDYARRLDANGGQETAGTDFNLAVTPENLDRGLALLADGELHPSFATADFNRAQRAALEEVSDHLVSVGLAVQSALNGGLLPQGDPSARVATPIAVANLTADKVRDYMAAAYRPERTTIVVVGDVTASRSYMSIKKSFGGWTDAGRPSPPPDDLPAIPTNVATRIVMPEPAIGVRIVDLGETLDLSPQSDDFEAFTAGMQALGGAAWSSRLVRDIYFNRGLAIGVKQQLDIEPYRSTVTWSYLCAPVNAVAVRNIITRDIEELEATPLPESELDLAKSLLIRQQLLQTDSPADIAAFYLGFAGLGLPLDEPDRRTTRYRALTPQDVMAALKRTLRSDGLVDVEFGAQ